MSRKFSTAKKELLGFYVSGHPVAKYENYFKVFSTMTVSKIMEGEGDVGVRVGGMIKSVAKKSANATARCSQSFSLKI